MRTLKIKSLHLSVSFLFIIANSALAQSSFIKTVQKVNESLVTIISTKTEIFDSSEGPAAIDPKTGKWISAKSTKTAQTKKVGAGVILHPQGLIITNLHTIKSANRVNIQLHDETIFKAKVLHLMPQHDLALIKIDTSFPLNPIKLADSNQVNLGDEVINIGNSQLLNRTISGGQISRLGTMTLGNVTNVEIIQINMNLYKGDSGGPLLDRQGRLIGMIAAKVRKVDRAALAIPSNKIKKLYLEFLK